MDLSDENRSASSGMYGSSNYPPMFDDEPPPMDDFDDDDDDFADFQSTNAQNTDWNPWPEQSSKDRKIETKNEISFGDFSAFDKRDDEIQHESCKNDDIGQKTTISNGFSESSDNFGNFNAFDARNHELKESCSKPKEKLDTKDKDVITKKEQLLAHRTEKNISENNKDSDNLENDGFVKDNNEGDNIVRFGVEKNEKEINFDNEFGDFGQVNGEFIDGLSGMQIDNKEENCESLTSVSTNKQIFDENKVSGFSESIENGNVGSCSSKNESESSQHLECTGHSGLFLEKESGVKMINEKILPDSINLGKERFPDAGLSDFDTVSKSCIELDKVRTAGKISDEGEMISPYSNNLDANHSLITAMKTMPPTSVDGCELKESSESLTENSLSKPISVHQEHLESSDFYSSGNEFTNFSQKSSMESCSNDDFGDFSHFNDNSCNIKSDCKGETVITLNEPAKVVTKENMQETATKNSETKNDVSGSLAGEFFSSASNKEQSDIGEDVDFQGSDNNFQADGDECQAFSIFKKSSDLSERSLVTKNLNFGATETGNDNQNGFDKTLHREDDENRINSEIISNSSLNAELNDNNISQNDENQLAGSKRSKIVESGICKEVYNKMGQEMTKVSSVGERSDFGCLKLQTSHPDINQFSGFENSLKVKTEVLSDGESKALSEDDDFGNFEDFSSFSGEKLKEQNVAFVDKNTVKSGNESAGALPAFRENRTIIDDQNFAKRNQNDNACEKSSDDLAVSKTMDKSQCTENLENNESLPSRVTGTDESDKDFGDFSEFQGPQEAHFPEAVKQTNENQSETEATCKDEDLRSKTTKNIKNDKLDEESFAAFQDFSKTEDNDGFFPTKPDSQDDNWSSFDSTQKHTSPTEVSQGDDVNDFDDFAAFSKVDSFGQEATSFSKEQSSDNFASFSKRESSDSDNIASFSKRESSDVDNFASFSKEQSPDNFASFSKRESSDSDNIASFSKRESSDVDNFASFSKEQSPDNFASFSKRESSDSDNIASFSKRESSDVDNFASFSKEQSDKFASFSKRESSDSNNFASFSKQGSTDDDNWGAFDTSQRHQHDVSTATTKKTANNAAIDDFNKRPSSHGLERSQNKDVVRKLSANLHPLLSPCFPYTNQMPSKKLPSNTPLLVAFLGQDKTNGLPSSWSKLIGSDEVEQSWNLSFQSSTNFKWMLTTVGVSYEHVVKKWKHSSHDTQSSLSPTSSVASFDVDSSAEPMTILVPEPAGKISSLLKPTLLAQSQQKELDLHRVPSITSLKKGDSGSETTSETASLDLEFFSGGASSIASSQSNKDLASLNDVDFFNMAADSVSSGSGDISMSKRGADSQPATQQVDKISKSLPFNLDALNKASMKKSMSDDTKRFLEQLEDLQFMNSSVLMFPSQFSSE